MQKPTYFILVAITLLFVTNSFSQGRYDSYNRLGISAGIHQFDIRTNVGSYKISEKHFSVEFGPALQLSEKFEIDSEFEDYILQGYDTFTAKEARQTNRLNLMGVIGVSAGFQSFKISLQYEYGFSNVLSKLTVANKKLEGTIEQLSVLATFYL